MSPIFLALALSSPAEASEGPAEASDGIALRGGVWEVFCTGGELMEITWFEDPANAWAYVQNDCGGVAKITGLELEVSTGRSDEPGDDTALYLARNGLNSWPGAHGELLMSDMDGTEGNRTTPMGAGNGEALDTFILGPRTTEMVGNGRVLIVLDPELYDQALAQFGPCSPGAEVTCEGRLELRTHYEMAGIKLTVQPDDRWARAQEAPQRLEWNAHPHLALTEPSSSWMARFPAIPHREQATENAIEQVRSLSEQDG